jgi:hypothetical protein
MPANYTPRAATPLIDAAWDAFALAAFAGWATAI